MGVILVFEIQSHKGKYRVDIVNNLTLNCNEGDIIVIDKFIMNNYKFSLNNEVLFYTIDSAEEYKTLYESQKLIDSMIEIGFNKNNKLISVGGGVIQDLVSFTASIYSRGVDWVFYPTTLLSQCDSCIGSKTSINYKNSKNKLGGFHPPKEIRIYRNFIETLPESEIKSGIGEMLHYFLLNHKIELSEQIVNDNNIIQNIEEYIYESLKIKKNIIEKDEFDKGERNLFNYGHTFGHAIESLSNYEINHGQAVTMGMRIANKISLNHKLISQDLYNKLDSILIKNIPVYKIEKFDKYIEYLKRDKKNISEKLTCILLDMDYGIKQEICYDEVRSILSEGF